MQNDPQKSFEIRLQDIWPILRVQKNVILLFLATVLVATFIGNLVTPKEYRATALLHLVPRTGQEVKVAEVVDLNQRGFYEVQQFYRTQIQILQSRSVRQEVVRRYNEKYEYDDLPIEGGAGMLNRMMLVVPKEQSQLLNIHVVHRDPVRAAILANLISKVYQEQNLERRQDAAREAKDWLEEKLREYRDRTEQANLALLEFKTEHPDMVDVEEEITALSAQMSSMNKAFGGTATERVQLESTVSSHRELQRKGDFVELAKVLDTAPLRSLERDLDEARAEDAALAERYLDKHPERQRMARRIDSLGAQIEQQVRKEIEAEEARLAVLKDEEARLSSEIDTLQADLLDFQRLKTQYRDLSHELERNESFHEQLSRRYDEVHLASRTQLNNVYIIDEATPPTVHIKPNMPLSMAIALIVGLVGGMGLALLREYIDDTVSSHLDVAAYLKVPFLGLVPTIPEARNQSARDLFTHFMPRSSVAEAVRGVRAMLELTPSGHSPHRVLVTSSVAREGKTGTAVRLGVSFAQMGRRVLIIEADLRRPRFQQVFSEYSEVGLTNYLVGAAEIDDICQPTEITGLDVIFAGASSSHPNELLASETMSALLDELDERYQLIIIDTPPSAVLSDAVSLSPLVDGIVLIVKEQAVSRHIVKQTLDRFRQVEANILGVILNNVDINKGGPNYKYYYAYRDYYSYTDDEAAKKPGSNP